MADMTDAEIKQALLQEWLDVLSGLWTAFGKPLDAGQLQVYRRALGAVPIGLLELAVARSIREHRFASVPTVHEIWQAVSRELGDPHDVLLAIEAWQDAGWARVLRRVAAETEPV